MNSFKSRNILFKSTLFGQGHFFLKMENKSFFIQYSHYEPIEINSHFNNDKTGSRLFALETVGHLIAAAEETRQLGLQKHYGPLGLYSVSDGVQIIYNSWDFLSCLGENGRNKKNPLVVGAFQGIEHYSTASGIFIICESNSNSNAY